MENTPIIFNTETHKKIIQGHDDAWEWYRNRNDIIINGDVFQISQTINDAKIVLVPFFTAGMINAEVYTPVYFKDKAVFKEIIANVNPMMSMIVKARLESTEPYDIINFKYIFKEVMGIFDISINPIQYCDSCKMYKLLPDEDRYYQCCDGPNEKRTISHCHRYN